MLFLVAGPTYFVEREHCNAVYEIMYGLDPVAAQWWLPPQTYLQTYIYGNLFNFFNNTNIIVIHCILQSRNTHNNAYDVVID